VLEISSDAAEAIKGILALEEVPEGAAFRISAEPGPGPDDAGGFAVTVIESPLPEDQIVVAADDVEVCVEPVAAEELDDKQLDASVSEGKVQFSLSDQAA
jgi:Fe-S cluster assembly iron-binding protein IscA